MQAAVDYPLSLYGTGGQTRAFIPIRDTAQCIELAPANPPRIGERVQICHQMTETDRVRDLANRVVAAPGARIDYLPNPCFEAAENDRHVADDRRLQLGLRPFTLIQGLCAEVTDSAAQSRSPSAAEPGWIAGRTA